MRRATIIEGQAFDWDSGAEAMKHIIDSNGNINYRAAAYADPGVTQCPKCLEYYWAEGIKLRCLNCQTEFDTYRRNTEIAAKQDGK